MTGWFLLAALLLLIANAFFVAVEFALLASRVTRLEPMAEDDDRRAAIALASIKDLQSQLAGAQLGITMASLGLGFVAEPAIATLIESVIESFVEIPSNVLHASRSLGAVARGGGAHGDRRDGSEEHRDRHPGALGSDPRPDSSGCTSSSSPRSSGS